MAGAFTACTVVSLSRYLRFDDGTYDLGIFTEYVQRFAHFQAPVVNVIQPGENLLGDHFHPVLALLAPFYRIFPTPVTLLVAQALLIAISVIPVSRAATELLGRGPGQAVALAYGFSWGLQEMAGFEFHELAFAVPLLAFSMSALVRNRPGSAALWALPLVFVKEDQGVAVIAIGLLIAVIHRKKAIGLAVAAWGLIWSGLAVAVIIPHFNPGHVYRFTGKIPLHEHGALLTGVLHLFFAHFGTKAPVLALFFLPTLFLALRSPFVLVAVPGLLLRFISTDPHYWEADRHYNAAVMPVVFAAAIDALWLLRQRPQRERLRKALAPAGAAAMAAACLVLAFSHPLRDLWQTATYRITPHAAAAGHAVALIPDGASVAANTDLIAPLVPRTEVYWYGNSALWLGKAAGNPVTQYVIFDRLSPDNAESPKNPLSFVETFSQGARYRLVYASQGIFVYTRQA